MAGDPHGTHVSGIAMGRNTVSGASPIGGVARRATLFSINIFESNGFTYSSSIIRALEHIEDQMIANANLKVRSVNMSLGGGRFTGYCDDADDPQFKAVIDRLRNRKVSTVVAAGNDGFVDAMGWPACVSSVYSVGSTSRAGDAFAYYTNISRYTSVLAPGGDVINGGGVVSSILGSNYATYQGTSMAAPQVAGAVASLAGKFPGKAISAIEEALRRTGIRVVDNRRGDNVGKTLVRVNAARVLLSQTPIPAPGNDNFGNAYNIANINSWRIGSTLGASRQAGEPPHGKSTIWYKWKAGRTGPVTITSLGSNFDTILSVYRGTTLGNLVLLGRNDDADSTTKSSKVTFNAVKDQNYRIAVASPSGVQGTVRLESCIHCGPPAIDNFASAREGTISGSTATVLKGRNSDATTQSGEPTAHGYRSVWWKFTAPYTGAMIIDTEGSTSKSGGNLDTKLAVYTGSSLTGLTLIGSNDDSPTGRWSRLSVNLTSGTTYHVAVGNYWSPTSELGGPVRLTFTPVGP